MVKQDTLTSDLESIVGVEGLDCEESLSTFSVDGVEPKAMVSPSNIDDVAKVLRYANDRGLTVIVWGGGSEIHIGNPPENHDIALSTAKMSALVEHEPADLTATCQAGMTLGTLQETLAKDGQTAPFDPHLPRSATIGGLLATNAAGAARHAYGTPRDFTIGASVVTGDGLVTKAGGKVVKNVAGYDMCKLYIGSRGTLGVITETTFKLTPLPAVSDRLTYRSTSADAAAQVAADVYRRGLSVRSAVLANSSAVASFAGIDAEYLLAMEFAGTMAGVQRSIRETQTLAVASGLAEVPADVTQKACEAFVARSDHETIVRCSILPSQVPELIEAIEDRAPEVNIIATPLAGTVRAGWSSSDDVLMKVFERTRSLEASVVIESCPPNVKAEIDVFGAPPSSLELMRRIKQQFDPGRVLSPGRFIDGI